MGPAENLGIADQLRHHVEAIQEDWPTQLDRDNDFAIHLRVSEMLRRVKSHHSR